MMPVLSVSDQWEEEELVKYTEIAPLLGVDMPGGGALLVRAWG